MSGHHSRLHRVDEKKQANMMRKKSEIVERKLSANSQKKEVNFYNIYMLYVNSPYM